MDILLQSLFVDNLSLLELLNELLLYRPPIQKQLTDQGEWGSTSADNDPSTADVDIAQIRETLAILSREFRVLISVLLTDLAWQGDTEMRFLGIRLNYNEVPQPFCHELNTCRFINLFDARVGGEINEAKNVMVQRLKSQKMQEFEKKGKLR